MAFTSESFGERLFESVGRSYRGLPGMLEALACALVSHVRLQSLHMHLNDIGSLTVERQARGLVSRWEAPSDPLAPAIPARSFPTKLDQDISYAGRTLGRIHACTTGPGEATSPLLDLLPQFAGQCGRLVMRDRLEKWSLGRLGQPLRLIGLSSAMRDRDRFIEIASASPLPVMLQGEFGTEKLAVAAAIHCSGPQADKPFVAVDCGDPDGVAADWVMQARGGTLYLSAIDCLSMPLQHALPRHLPSRLSLWPHAGQHRAPRLIASTTVDPAQLVAQGRFSRELAQELTILEAKLPPLRERSVDLAALACDTVARLGFDADRVITEELLDACTAYAWPENLAELERLLGRLATMAAPGAIRAGDIRRLAPALVSKSEETGEPAPAAWAPPAGTALDRWALRALDPNEEFLELDPGLAKAVRHLGTSFEEAIELAELAAVAGTKPLRLSAQFRSTVGVSFKHLLRHIRITVACELLANEPQLAITQLAFQVGFGDLSYFERSFRSALGVSPRQFRQRRRLDDRSAGGSIRSDSARISSGYSQPAGKTA